MDIFVPSQFLLYDKSKSWLTVLSTRIQLAWFPNLQMPRQQIFVHNKHGLDFFLRLRVKFGGSYAFLLSGHLLHLEFSLLLFFVCSIPIRGALKLNIFCGIFSTFLFWNALDHRILSVFWTLFNFYYASSLRMETHASLDLTESSIRPAHNICSIKFAKWNEETAWYTPMSRAWWLLEITRHYT